MHRRGVFTFPLAALAAGALRGDPANGDPRLETLFSTFIAPCCWRENLLAHHSPEADALRADIRRRVAAGESDAAIQQAYVVAYSRRILATPDGGLGQWLSWTPVAAAAAGAVVTGLVIRRMRAAAPKPAPVSLPDIELELEHD